MLRVDGNQIKYMKEKFWCMDEFEWLSSHELKTQVTVEDQGIKRCPEELTLLTYKQISQNFQDYSLWLRTSPLLSWWPPCCFTQTAGSSGHYRQSSLGLGKLAGNQGTRGRFTCTQTGKRLADFRRSSQNSDDQVFNFLNMYTFLRTLQAVLWSGVHWSHQHNEVSTTYCIDFTHFLLQLFLKIRL